MVISKPEVCGRVGLNPSDTRLSCGILQLKKEPEYSLHYTIVFPGVLRNFFFGGGSTNSVEDREDGDLGAVAP